MIAVCVPYSNLCLDRTGGFNGNSHEHSAVQCRRLRHEPVFFNVAIKYYIPNLDHRHLRVTETLIGEHVPHTTTRKKLNCRKRKFLSLNFATKLQVTLLTHVTGLYERDLLNFFFDRVSNIKYSVTKQKKKSAKS